MNHFWQNLLMLSVLFSPFLVLLSSVRLKITSLALSFYYKLDKSFELKYFDIVWSISSLNTLSWACIRSKKANLAFFQYFFPLDSENTINRIKMRNWYIMSPMKIPKQLFYDFCMKFSICKYHTRRIFLNFWLREGGKNIWIFAGFPDSWLETVSENASEFRVYKKV